VPSVGQGPSPCDALSSARLRPSRRRGFATAAPAIDAVGPGRAFVGSRGPSPRPRVPLPAGGALLWARDIACRLLQPYTTRGHTRRASDPRARAGLSLRCSPAGDAGCVGGPMRLHASEGPRATTRAGHGSERPSEGKRAAFCERFRAPFLVELPAPGSSIRASCGNWSLPQTRRTDRDPRAMPLRESDSARRIKAPSAETELLRERRIAPPGAPEPRLRHAASAEALLRSAHAFLTGS
jgi:hypothetical protein